MKQSENIVGKSILYGGWKAANKYAGLLVYTDINFLTKISVWIRRTQLDDGFGLRLTLR